MRVVQRGLPNLQYPTIYLSIYLSIVPGGKKEENMKREKLKPSWLGVGVGVGLGLGLGLESR